MHFKACTFPCCNFGIAVYTKAKLNSGKGKIKGGRKKRGKDNPYGDNADDMFFDRTSMQKMAQRQLQNSDTKNYTGWVAKPATRGTSTMYDARVSCTVNTNLVAACTII